MPVPQPWPAEPGVEDASFARPPDESAEPALVGEEREDETAVAAVPADVLNDGIPFTSETERVLEKTAAEAPVAPHGESPPATPSPIAAEEADPVTERPAKPRRGWWQRLTQS